MKHLTKSLLLVQYVMNNIEPLFFLKIKKKKPVFPKLIKKLCFLQKLESKKCTFLD